MKKIIAFVFCACLAMNVFAETCPQAKQVVQRDEYGRYIITTPQGWWLAESHPVFDFVHFSVAAWGDHHKPQDNVRCYYYASTSSVEAVKLVSLRSYRKNQFNNSNWSHETDNYSLCTSADNVSVCSFA